MSDPQRPHGPQPSRLLCPWDFPGRSTGVGCHCLLRLKYKGLTKVTVDFLKRSHGKSIDFENRSGFVFGVASYWCYGLGRLAMIPLFIFLSPHLAHVSLHECYSLYTWGAPSVVVESDMHLNDYHLAWLIREVLAKGLGLVTQKWQILSNLASEWLARRQEDSGWLAYSPVCRISTSRRTSRHSLSHLLKRRWKRL